MNSSGFNQVFKIENGGFSAHPADIYMYKHDSKELSLKETPVNITGDILLS